MKHGPKYINSFSLHGDSWKLQNKNKKRRYSYFEKMKMEKATYGCLIISNHGQPSTVSKFNPCSERLLLYFTFSSIYYELNV